MSHILIVLSAELLIKKFLFDFKAVFNELMPFECAFCLVAIFENEIDSLSFIDLSNELLVKIPLFKNLTDVTESKCPVKFAILLLLLYYCILL